MANNKIFVAGHNGMVGSAVVRKLNQEKYGEVITVNRSTVDLKNQDSVYNFVRKHQPTCLVLAAARVGGILANNTFPYQFIYDNLQIQNNLINACFEVGVRKVIFLGSSCIYPKFSKQPIKEEYLLTGVLEPTNEWYAIAKIAGLKLIEALRKQYQLPYVSLMPTNLYGPNDNFDLKTSHVLPALIRKFHEAKLDGNRPVTVWGTGTPMREFLHVDDLADAVFYSVSNDLEDSLYNVGTGVDLSIRELAELIQKIVGHSGDINWDDTKPDGTPRKLLDISRLRNQGWCHKISLEEGIYSTYDWFLNNQESFKEVKIN
jgi:GDP-L-fucose synthase